MYKSIVPDQPSQPIKIYNVAITALLAIMLSVGFAFVLNYLRTNELFKLVEQKESSEPAPPNVQNSVIPGKKRNKRSGLSNFFYFIAVLLSGTILAALIFSIMQKAGF
jgi:hypothetical protein